MIKALLVVLVFFTDGTMITSHIQYNSMDECKAAIEIGLTWGKTTKSDKGAEPETVKAFCTTKWRAVEGLTV